MDISRRGFFKFAATAYAATLIPNPNSLKAKIRNNSPI